MSEEGLDKKMFSSTQAKEGVGSPQHKYLNQEPGEMGSAPTKGLALICKTLRFCITSKKRPWQVQKEKEEAGLEHMPAIPQSCSLTTEPQQVTGKVTLGTPDWEVVAYRPG